MSGDKVGGIASFNSCGGSIQMSDVRISTEFKAKEILGTAPIRTSARS